MKSANSSYCQGVKQLPNNCQAIGKQLQTIAKQLQTIAERYKFKLTDPIADIPKEALEVILHGGKESFKIQSKAAGVTRNYQIDFEGIVSFIENQYKNTDSSSINIFA